MEWSKINWKRTLTLEDPKDVSFPNGINAYVDSYVFSSPDGIPLIRYTLKITPGDNPNLSEKVFMEKCHEAFIFLTEQEVLKRDIELDIRVLSTQYMDNKRITEYNVYLEFSA